MPITNMVLSTRSSSEREAKGMSMAEVDRQTEARMAWDVLHCAEVDKKKGLRGWLDGLVHPKGQ